MKQLAFSLLLSAALPFSASAAPAYPGAWVDVDVEANLAALEKSGDQKAFCGRAYIKDEQVDSMLSIGTDGQLLLCKLTLPQASPLGANCRSFGSAEGEALEVRYSDGSSVKGEIKKLGEDHLEVSLRHPKQGQYVPIEVWEIKRIGEARISALSAAYQACLKQ